MRFLEPVARWLCHANEIDPEERMLRVTEVGVSNVTVQQWEAYTPQAAVVTD